MAMAIRQPSQGRRLYLRVHSKVGETVVFFDETDPRETLRALDEALAAVRSLPREQRAEVRVSVSRHPTTSATWQKLPLIGQGPQKSEKRMHNAAKELLREQLLEQQREAAWQCQVQAS